LLDSSAGSQDVRPALCWRRALDLHRGEEPAIETRRLVVIFEKDTQHRLAVLVVLGGPPVRGHGVVERLGAVGVSAVEELVRRVPLILTGLNVHPL